MDQVLGLYWKSRASLNRYKLRVMDFAFLLMPIIVGVVSYYISERVYSIIVERYIGGIQFTDISSFEVLKDVSYESPKVNLEVGSLISILNFPEKFQSQNLGNVPPLSDLKFGDIQGQKATDSFESGLGLKLQGIYVSETDKFAIIDGKIYREDMSTNLFKVVKIEEKMVLVELSNKERRWLQLK